jgi:hypothetical protein
VRIFAAASVLLLGACSLLAQQPSVDLRPVPATYASVRVERATREGDAIAIVNELTRAIANVERVFARPFADQPKVVYFSSSDTFAQGTQQVLNYSRDMAAMVAGRYGAIFDRDTQVIAVNGGAATQDRIVALLQHELTHQMERQVSAGADLPVWFDEGIATQLEIDALPDSERWPDQYALAARAVAAMRPTRLSEVTSLQGWHDTFGRVGTPLYSYAWQAVALMEEQVGWNGLVGILQDVADGESLTDAYRSRSGEGIADLETRLAKNVAPMIVTKQAESGEALWSVFTGAAGQPTLVTISGNSTYVVTFTVATDEWGIYRGSFGSTAPRGSYFISAAGAKGLIDTRPR